jgi:hypothetical protein
MRHETYSFHFGFGTVADQFDQRVQSKLGFNNSGRDQRACGDQRHDQYAADALSVAAVGHWRQGAAPVNPGVAGYSTTI